VSEEGRISTDIEEGLDYLIAGFGLTCVWMMRTAHRLQSVGSRSAVLTPGPRTCQFRGRSYAGRVGQGAEALEERPHVEIETGTIAGGADEARRNG